MALKRLAMLTKSECWKIIYILFCCRLVMGPEMPKMLAFMYK